MDDETYSLAILLVLFFMWMSMPEEKDVQKRHKELIKEIQKLQMK